MHAATHDEHNHNHAASPAITPVRVARGNPHMDLEAYDPEGDLMVLNMGPQHPSTHGVFRVKLYMDGEVVVKAIPYLGYLHRGVEKLCEKLTYVQITPIVDKNDYVSPMMNELAINMAFEALGKVEVPRRARYLRTVCAELQRVASHMLWLGTFALDMGGALGGGASVFMYTFQDRDMIMDLFEELTGARFHYNYHQIGGVRVDIPAGWDTKVFAAADRILHRLHEYEEMLGENAIFRARTVGVGKLDANLAMELGVAGPALRASGVDFDLRKARPYAAYDEIQVNTFVDGAGDCFARYKVRVQEIRESIRIATTLLKGIPTGPIMGGKFVKLPGGFKPPAGSAYAAVESPRGELGTYVMSDGTPNPYRCKIRPPSYHALSLVPYLLPGVTISDVVTILGSIDPIMGEADR